MDRSCHGQTSSLYGADTDQVRAACTLKYPLWLDLHPMLRGQCEQ